MSLSGGSDDQTGVPESPSPRSASQFPRPWQPLTPRGAAAFARASLNTVCCFQGIVAVFSACAVMWFLHAGVFPVFRQAIAQLPEEGDLLGGELHFPKDTPPVVAENGWLALRVDLEAPLDQALLRDLEIRFGANAVRLCSGVGTLTLIYPPDWKVPFNHLELTTWWEAWQKIILASVGFVTVCSLMLTWWGLATLYAPLPRMLAFFGDRDLPIDGAWRMSAASLLAGAVFVSVGLVAFGFDWIRLPQFLLFFGVHWLIPIVYLVVGTTVLPPRPLKSNQPNPFVPEMAQGAVDAKVDEVVASPSMSAIAVEPIPTLKPVGENSLPKGDTSGPSRGTTTETRTKKHSNPFAKLPPKKSSEPHSNPFAGEADEQGSE